MSQNDCTMVVFGGTGNLSHSKIVPALYNLHIDGQLPSGFSMVGIGRKEKSHQEYRDELADSVKKYSSSSWDEAKWPELSARLYYHACDVRNEESYPRLKETLESCSRKYCTDSNYLYFMALAPHFFPVISENLYRHDLAVDSSGWRRIMVEKPFGYDLGSARELNSALSKAFKEKNIFRIDHYLGKEMLQNILVVRFANAVFEPLWNNRFIDHVQISVAESDGIGGRGTYYDRAGAMRDMVQSHLLQMLAITAMESPEETDSESIRKEKLKLLNKVEIWPEEDFPTKLVFGQYSGFRQEKDIAPHSETETFAALKLAVDNNRWRGVPFYLRTGKKMQDKLAKIVIQFKKPPELFFRAPLGSLQITNGDLLNILTLKVQPREGVVFQFNMKKPATIDEIVPVEMDFCQPCAFLINTPEAYERLIADAMDGDPARFTSWSEVESSWTLVDKIYDQYKQSRQPVYKYGPGSAGPGEALEMLSRNGQQWWD